MKLLPVRKPQAAHDRELKIANEKGIRPARSEENGTGTKGGKHRPK